MNRLKASYHTLGCKLNFSETATIGKMMEQRGIGRVEKGDIPDLCFVNTCSVTDTADKKGRQLIRKLNHRYPYATIIVTGCYAQLKPEEVAALPGVGMVVGSKEKLKLGEYIDQWLLERRKRIEVTPGLQIGEFMGSCERGDRTRYFLKVQDGCDYFCTYCTIPFARGRSRSGNIGELVSMARQVAEAGGREIVITGVNIGTFGKDNGQDFFDLLKSLDEVEGIERYRISSIEPNLLTDEIIEWVAEKSRTFMPHFHIPLQSGSDHVLRLMNRRYDTSLFQNRVSRIRQLIPDAFIGVDIIAGARGETPEEWEKSLRFAESLDISKFHVFPYSERPGTKALLLGDEVPMDQRHRRVEILNRVSSGKTREFIEGEFGKVRKVLWEQRTHGSLMQGLTDNYIRVSAPYDPMLINTVTKVKLSGFLPDSSELVSAQHI